jgi:hypothetical protein
MRILPALTAAASLAALSMTPALAAVQPVNPPPEPAPPSEMAPPQDNGADYKQLVLPGDSPTPVDQAWRLKAGDPTVTSNTPVPDTPDVRAEFGGPDSHGGKQTRPVGN